MEISGSSQGERYSPTHSDRPIERLAHPLERNLVGLLHFLRRSGHSLDQQWHRAGDWQDENARPNGAWLQNLTGDADRLDVGRNEIQLTEEFPEKTLLSYQFPKLTNRKCSRFNFVRHLTFLPFFAKLVV